jgi:cell division septation protein DedD
MKENNTLTYILYAALIGLVGLAGYKIWQKKQAEQEALKQEQAATEQQRFNELGYTPADSTSSYVGGTDSASDKVAYIPPKSDASGIEDDGAAAAAAKPAASSNSTTAKTPAKTTDKGPAPIRNVEDSDGTDGRYRVIAGSFTKMDGARREMERLVKMGYHDAEVGRYNRGKFGVVIVKRTNSLSEAKNIEARLKKKGVDATVFDSNRK